MDQLNSTISECLQHQEVESLLGGELTASDMHRVLAHLAGCKNCRDAVQSASRREPAAESSGSNVRSNQTEPPTTEDTMIEPASRASEPDPAVKFEFLIPPESPDEIGRLGGYRIIRVIGEGGMGVVFEAEDPQLGRHVAIKVLQPRGLETLARERFLKEARLAASLASARIVTIHQIGQDRNCPFIVMELLHGESLDNRLQREHSLPVSEALRITREVAEGLAVAHEQGLIHRDIKPANIWLERPRSAQESPPVKLLDFGIARSMEANAETRLTMEGRIVGTPSYLCPEQACNEPLDGRSDLFSLGCVLYAMLAGDSPFERGNMILSIRAVLDDEPQPLADDVPVPVVALVHRLLSKNPEDRPASAQQVVDEIRQLEMPSPKADQLPTTLTFLKPIQERNALHRVNLARWTGMIAVALLGFVGVWILADRFFTSRKPPAAGKQADVIERNVASPSGPNAVTGGLTRPNGYEASPVEQPIKVGILHSLTGPMATSERPVVDAWRFAIDEINQAGGLLGRKIKPIERDGKSYDDVFARQAEDLIVNEQVATLFGCWRSSCRKSVADVCQKHDHLLVYPTAYEGLEESPYVIYMGGAPNQQVLPCVKWAFAFLNKRKFFLIGTDGVFSRCVHEIIQDEVAELGGKIVGNQYRMLADNEFTSIAPEVQKSGADVVINTVVGSGNISLFSALYKVGIRPDTVPVISMNVTEEELRTLSAHGRDIAGNYAAWSYFQSLPNRANQEFLSRFHERFGSTRVVNDPMVAAYTGMHLWALAVKASQSDRPADIRMAFTRQQYESPEGLVKINPLNRHAWRMALIGQVNEDFHFDMVWNSPALDPQPFPPYRTRLEWEEFVSGLYKNWGNHWSPEPSSTP